MLGGAGFGNCNDLAAADRPGQRYGGRRAASCGGNLGKRGVTQQAGAGAAERRIGHYRYAVPRAPGQQLGLDAAIAEVVKDLIGGAEIAVRNAEQVFHVADLASIVAAFEALRSGGKIRAWGVSNFTVADMENLFRVPHGDRCATNQVLYNIGSRDIERDLLPWCAQRGVPVMAYSPLGGAGASVLRDPTLVRIAAAHNCSAAAVALAWTIRSGTVIAIPESGSVEHVRENAIALSLVLTPDELHALDGASPPPRR